MPRHSQDEADVASAEWPEPVTVEQGTAREMHLCSCGPIVRTENTLLRFRSGLRREGGNPPEPSGVSGAIFPTLGGTTYALAGHVHGSRARVDRSGRFGGQGCRVG